MLAGHLQRQTITRRLGTAVLLGVLMVALLTSVPGLRPVVREIREVDPVWVGVALALELASCLSFVAIFRLFFDRLPAADGRALAWTSMASGALLPGGGVGGLAIGGWLIRMTGPPITWIVRRSSGLFFLTSAVNCAVVLGAGLMFIVGGAGEHSVLLGAVPAVAATAATLLVAALPRLANRDGRAVKHRWLGDVGDGITDARNAIHRPSWRLLGALGYLGFDIAVLWATFSAVGHAPAVPVLALGFTIGYLANTLPVPGGLGVLDAGLIGALVLYGAPATEVGAAVLIYHAIALWVPSLGGVVAYARLRPRLNATEPAEPRSPIATSKPEISFESLR